MKMNPMRGYEPSKKEKLDRFFNSVEWDAITSNVERLPYLAKMLEENTPKIKVRPAKDDELFLFAQHEHWKERLDLEAMEYMKTLIADYEEALKRIRRSRHIGDAVMLRRNDIERILYARGQENEYSADELYSVFNAYDAKRIHELRALLTEEQWHLMNRDEREQFLNLFLPYGTPQQYHTLFADFRHGGFRVLGDVICDLDDAFTAEKSKRQRLHRNGDSAVLRHLIAGCEQLRSADYSAAVAHKCRQYINLKINVDTALQCAVALGKRKFAFEVLPDRIEPNAARRVDSYAK